MATPTDVIITTGYKQHSVTVIIEFKKDLETTGSGVTYSALSTIITSGDQAKGDTGLNIWIIGLTAVFKFLLSPTAIPKGTATIAASG